MTNKTGVSGQAIKQALEGRDGKALASFYTDDAVITIIDRNNTPSRPLALTGRAAISNYWADVCGRDMTHAVDIAASDDTRIAFTESCAYPDGVKVFCAAVLDLDGGRIKRQTTIQAWDE
ncbi:MAG TPA: nuclear transport factor 2 family protein [Rhizobiaceae bacterium]|nr:nuclear transport factor 2 family protein [Rhizobiaceae bacterium]